MEVNEEGLSNPESLEESEEGIEVKVFLQTLKRIYHVNESVGTYVCSKMKNFMNNYRHKTKRLIFEGLKANNIISSKVNDIIETALRESCFEKVFESLSDLYYSPDFVKNPTATICKVKPQHIQSRKTPNSEVKASVMVSPLLNLSTEASGESSNATTADASSSSTPATNSTVKTKRVFVEHGNTTKIIQLKGFSSVDSLKVILRQELGLLENDLTSSYIIHYSKSKRKWIPLKTWKALTKDETLKICKDAEDKEPEEQVDIEPPLTIEPQDPPSLGNPELLLEEHIEEIISEYKSSGGKKPWVLSFKLPQFGAKLVAKMDKGEITSRERIKICQAIQDYVALHDWNPGPKEIAIILKILFLTYPKLAEADKDYWVTWNIWKVSLGNAFSKNSTKETPKPIAPPSPEKNKGTKRKLEAASNVTKKRNVTLLGSTSARKGQEVCSGGGTTSIAVCSTSAPMPPKRLSAGMEATFEERRQQIVTEGWNIEDVLLSYPWLHNENEVFAEFSRIANMDQSVDLAIEEGFRKVVYAVLHGLRTHAKYRVVVEKEKELRKDTDKKGGLEDFEYKMALFALPFALGEDIEDIFKPEGSVYEEPIQIEYSGSGRYEDGKNFAVIIDNAKVECSSLKKAVAVFLSSFFIFNMAYPSDIKRFLYFVERNLLGIPGKAPPPSQVVKLVKKVDDYLDNSSG